MIRSMTGYGRGTQDSGSRLITVEMKAVNHRYCDVIIRAPRRYGFAEEQITTAVRSALHRGRIEVSLQVDSYGESESEVRLNREAAEQYIRALRELQALAGAEAAGGTPEALPLSLLAAQPEVLRTVPREEDAAAFARDLAQALTQALAQLTAMRETEGEKLAEDIRARVQRIAEIRESICRRAPELEREYADRLREHLHELLEGEADVPEERILTEAAVFADKANITEELVRLGSHIDQMGSFLTGEEEPIGKKMDFLVQEMNREANTIGSKSNDVEITARMLELKAEIEKIREQVQNIE